MSGNSESIYEKYGVNITRCSVVLDRNCFLSMMNLKKSNRTKKEVAAIEKSSKEIQNANQNVRKVRRTLMRPEEDLETSGDDSSEYENVSIEKNRILERKLNEEKLRKFVSKLLICKICKMEFEFDASFVAHQLSHKPKSYKCTICKEAFKFRTSFTNHMKRQHPELEHYPCEFPGCDESFRTKFERKKHANFHLKYMCRFCKKRYFSKKIMRLHVKETHFKKKLRK